MVEFPALFPLLDYLVRANGLDTATSDLAVGTTFRPGLRMTAGLKRQSSISFTARATLTPPSESVADMHQANSSRNGVQFNMPSNHPHNLAHGCLPTSEFRLLRWCRFSLRLS